MRLPAPRARRRSTVLGEPFLRAVSTGATNAAEPPQPVEAPAAQSVDPFRGMIDLLDRCLKAEGEIAGIEDTLARDPDALSPDEFVAPVAAVLADTQADLERMPPGPARRRVVEAARREGLALTDRVLEADARADRRFKEGTITAAADRLAARVARDPGALDASLTMLNDLIDTADLDAGDKRLVAANLEARVREAAKPPEPNSDASATPGEEPAASGQTSSSDAGDTEQVVREGKSDALTFPSEAGDIVQVAREGKSDPIRPPPEIAAQLASRIREFQAFLNADRGEGKSIADAQEEFANNVDRQFRKVLRDRLGEGAVAGRDEFNAVFERGYRELQRWLHGEIDRIGERDGYTDEQIADLKIIADTGVVTLGIIGPGGRPGRGGRGGDRDGRDDQDNPENEQRDRDADDGRNEDQSEDGGDGSRSDGDDAFERIDVSKIKVPKVVKARDPLTSDELAGMLQRKERRVDPHRLRTLQDKVSDKFKKNEKGHQKKLVDTVREFFTKKDLASLLPEISIFVDGEGKVWTLDHRRVVAARVATQIAQKHGLDTVFKMRFKVVSMKDRDVREKIVERLNGRHLNGFIIEKDGLSIEVKRPPPR